MDMKKTLVILAALAAITAFAAPSFAAKSKGGNATTATSSIALDTVTNGDGTTVKVAAGSIQPSLGSKVTFASTIEPLQAREYPMVAVWCYQNSATVYMDLGQPGAQFTLGGGSSAWLTNGGDASCKGVLYAYGWKAGQETVRQLASSDPFTATGP
jgi:hypothetical protein